VSDHVSDQAIIRTGGKQYRVEVGAKLRVEKLDAEVGSVLDGFDVLFVGRGDGARVGTPVVAGAKVVAKVRAHGRGKKLVVYKFRRRKNYRRRNGHRQWWTELEITGITA
jgi:large subunit ribosomal protein L21